MNLTKSQLSALDHITKYASSRKESAQRTLTEILYQSDIDPEKFSTAVSSIKSHARVGLHFHSDRPDPNMRPVAEAMLEQGIYRNQFETRLSSGGVSAYPGGDRDIWEQRIFGGSYHLDGTTVRERPKYGSLNLMVHPDGPSPRFGSCYFLLNPEISQRCTYTYLDSHQDPKEKGTYDEFDDILAALMRDAFFGDFAIGERNLTTTKLVEHLLSNLEKPFEDPSNQEANRNLNHYIEAQVHGDISLQDDVDLLVADPSFKSVHIGEILHQLCSQYSIDLYWHMGFAMWVQDVPTDFRGPAMPSLAKRISQKDAIDTSMIGIAAMDLKRDPASWSSRGTYEDVLQELKLLWHVLVRFQSARLTIRDQVWDDLDDYTRLVTDAKAMKYMGSIRCDSLNQARESLDFSIREAQSERRTRFFFAILESDSERYVGDVGFTVKSETNTGGIGHLGFFLLPEFWHKGYATESAIRVIQFAFEQNPLHKIESGCLVENTASERVLQKCGMSKEGDFRMHSLHEGVWKDRVAYGLLRTDWTQRKKPSNSNHVV